MALTERQRRRREDAKLAYAAFIPYYPLALDDLPGEIWRDIAGYNGDYQVSTFGRVKSFKYKSPHILKPKLAVEYLRVDLYTGGKLKHQKVHVLVAKAFIPNPEHKPEVNHDDGHKFNCHVSNLYWATTSENVQHAYDNSLAKSGEDNYLAGLTNEQARYIRDNPDNLTQEELAAMFGVKQSTISRIQLGKTYANAGGNIRKPKKQRVPDEIRERIRVDWATGTFSYAALARKFGYNRTTIWKIVHEG